jgi:hypothetical protein
MGQEVVRHGFKFVLAFLRAVSEGANVVAFCWEFRILATDMEKDSEGDCVLLGVLSICLDTHLLLTHK